ncbi:hypothetical protein ACLOJK_028326 [Asimina triloba]
MAHLPIFSHRPSAASVGQQTHLQQVYNSLFHRTISSHFPHSTPSAIHQTPRTPPAAATPSSLASTCRHAHEHHRPCQRRHVQALCISVRSKQRPTRQPITPKSHGRAAPPSACQRASPFRPSQLHLLRPHNGNEQIRSHLHLHPHPSSISSIRRRLHVASSPRSPRGLADHSSHRPHHPPAQI